ncbi:SDR family NAD(P)-dependent oxidoreductase [Sphingobium phenoxybenzoativorans]|uniref:SDR family NAD(P)-dependent oxidoreductase n=1 Tax=Sphingobium phenoxybenzoativorans TaxID=1592790 RepID=UPI000872C45A|nr:SDR family oxidoreductase [Sphingobium phenoxybenzoativorans]
MELLDTQRLALVTGAVEGGIGFRVAERLAAEGARQALVDIDGDAIAATARKLAEATGTEVRGYAADIADPASVLAMAEAVRGEMGEPEILINCAAIVSDKLFLESDYGDWSRMTEICLYGPMNLIKTFAPAMVERQYGRIICLASDSARLGQARLSYYAAAKAGVIALCKSVAQELGPSSVTVNVVSPGATNTSLRQAREASLLDQMGPENYAKREKKVLRMYPLRRIGGPDDIASMIAYVASDRASWVTGQVISVNGGFAMP